MNSQTATFVYLIVGAICGLVAWVRHKPRDQYEIIPQSFLAVFTPWFIGWPVAVVFIGIIGLGFFLLAISKLQESVL